LGGKRRSHRALAWVKPRGDPEDLAQLCQGFFDVRGLGELPAMEGGSKGAKEVVTIFLNLCGLPDPRVKLCFCNHEEIHDVILVAEACF
jgi:hypothetical protein